MKSKIDFNEALKDSPTFRSVLDEEEGDIDHLEQKIERVLKMCTAAVDSGKEYVKNNSAFATSLWDLQRHFKDDRTSHSALEKVIHCLQEMNKFHTILLDQASRTVLKNLTSFIKSEIKEVKDYKNLFLKVSENLDGALQKNAQVNKNKPTDVQETENYLSATRSCFQHTALDYVNILTMLQAKKKPEILSTLLSYVQACSTYYHQGSDLCEDFDPYFKVLADDICTMRSECVSLEKTMQNRHASVTNFDQGHTEGYLFKRTSKGFKTWNRRWFYISGNQLLYRKRNGEESPTVMEEDLSICTVRLASECDRRFCFEVISPAKNHMLQADSAESLKAWICALQTGIGTAIQNNNSKALLTSADSSKPSGDSKRVNWEYFLTIPGNSMCCDCGHPQPKWASINLGITLCIACSGIHRSLGVHYSKVRSLTLDAWEPEIIKVMTELGNGVVNRIYEATADGAAVERATENCDISVREAWIKAKYVERRFVASLTSITDALCAESARNFGTNHRRGKAFQAARWSVKKLRRRQKSTSLKATPAAEETASGESSSGQEEHDEEDCNEDKDDGDEKQPVKVDVVFGENLSEPLNQASFCLDSDDESVNDEEQPQDNEDIQKLNPDVLLYKAALNHNLPVMSQALALGANKNWTNAEDLDRTSLHQAVLSGSVMACEFLLLNGADINAKDRNGYTPLHLATEKGGTAQAYLLLKNRAKYDIVTAEGKQPIDIAVDNANADIVTLLRLTKLNEEIGLSEQGLGGDETYNDVMKDFSHFAINQPHRLQRPKLDDQEAE
ncbi:arf-GAP with coiled-coil, ANK repeat and PH domain-containing protein 2 [Phlebotomus argentipes]|uniref:arf-GAP with coiled-coil, ANK repeat and PH domain-containing protein 2 n=1 Tax=Phlebotomus argentipes TaxID=94469 RepID=UPI002892C1EA|nr:arf-GAP with coiled-coil, ANK repeat and PH domain-containing protein 2 [Phlebotomus argentipes]